MRTGSTAGRAAMRAAAGVAAIAAGSVVVLLGALAAGGVVLLLAARHGVARLDHAAGLSRRVQTARELRGMAAPDPTE